MSTCHDADLLTLTATARAAGITTRQLRNWVEFYPTTDGFRQPAGWRRFGPLDVARLAVMGPLVGYGVPTWRAFEIAKDHVGKGISALRVRRHGVTGGFTIGSGGEHHITIDLVSIERRAGIRHAPPASEAKWCQRSGASGVPLAQQTRASRGEQRETGKHDNP